MRKLWQRWAWVIFAAVFAALIFVPDLLPQRAPDPVVMEHIQCAAVAVALGQFLFTRQEAGQSLDPAFLAAFEARQDRLQDYLEGLRRRDDRHNILVRPVIAEAETARDASVAADGDAYIDRAWQDLRSCHDKLFPGVA
ncbi:hypothetical protein [Thetidibacter halocola]|uniref:Uncharacterized protein n=1 Tax=Thetidibacter halocola TaxID=2827239 RepID=A0A8J7WBX1_9RHOB|nr:hypothetical protein [Thetidibacter halocola]MBS0124687.1 hypothetical protein [Thetidibacter halocola]